MVLTTLDFSLGYGRLGWRCLPLWPGQKKPLYANWPVDASSDEKMLRQYFGGDPTRNIGVVTGEAFDAWDIEVEHLPAFGEYWRARGNLPEAPIARTGRGGMHILTQPTGVNHTRQLHLNGVHIGELKSAGGFIVVAPSVTDNPYSWTWAPAQMHLPVAPDWLLGLLERPTAATMRLKTRLASPDDVVDVLGRLTGSVLRAGRRHEGRNNYLYWAMRIAIEDGLPLDESRSALETAGLEAGLEPDEVPATLDSAIHAESAA